MIAQAQADADRLRAQAQAAKKGQDAVARGLDSRLAIMDAGLKMIQEAEQAATDGIDSSRV